MTTALERLLQQGRNKLPDISQYHQKQSQVAKGLNEGEDELFESESIGDQVMKNLDFSGPSASSMLLERMKQDATMKAGGGIMDINEMIRPIGK